MRDGLDENGNPLDRNGKEWYRASGELICKQCGKDYYSHPPAKEFPAWHGGAWLKWLCNGDLVKT